MKKTIFISAGDPSGDIHAARLMEKLLLLNPSIEFIGIGGKEMEKWNFTSIVPMEQISVVGFWEVAKRYSFFKKLLQECKDLIKDKNIDLFLPIDYPGFNIRLASFVKEQNIPVCYYIAPQLWAWGKSRTANLQESIDKLFVVFPFEEEFFRNQGIDAKFIGHPLLDDKRFIDIKLERKNNLIALLPGSRLQEVKNHLKLFINVIKEANKLNDFKFAVAKSSNIDISHFEEILKLENVELWEDSIELMKVAKIGIVKTGTSNLEAALSGMPFIMIYKTSQLTYNIGKYLINLDYISLVNILQHKSVIPELIQSDANPKNIAKELNSLYLDEDRINFINSEFQHIREKLGEYSASETLAQIIYSEVLNER